MMSDSCDTFTRRLPYDGISGDFPMMLSSLAGDPPALIRPSLRPEVVVILDEVECGVQDRADAYGKEIKWSEDHALTGMPVLVALGEIVFVIPGVDGDERTERDRSRHPRAGEDEPPSQFLVELRPVNQDNEKTDDRLYDLPGPRGYAIP